MRNFLIIVILISIFVLPTFGEEKIEVNFQDSSFVITKFSDNNIDWQKKIIADQLDFENPGKSFSIENNEILVFLPSTEKNVWIEFIFDREGRLKSTLKHKFNPTQYASVVFLKKCRSVLPYALQIEVNLNQSKIKYVGVPLVGALFYNNIKSGRFFEISIKSARFCLIFITSL